MDLSALSSYLAYLYLDNNTLVCWANKEMKSHPMTMSDSNITSINRNSFANYKNLAKLDLSFNSIKYLGDLVISEFFLTYLSGFENESNRSHREWCIHGS
jgi:hypothetical protein